MTQHTMGKEIASDTPVAATGNQNFRGRLIYKSGATQDLLIQAISTDVFRRMRESYFNYLGGSGPAFDKFGSGWTIVVQWSEVASFQDWVDQV